MRNSGHSEAPIVLVADHAEAVGGAQMALASLLASTGNALRISVITTPQSGLLTILPIDDKRVFTILPSLTSFNRHGSILRNLRGALATLRATWGIYKALDQIAPNLVLANTPKAALLLAPIGRLRRVPVAWHVRERLSPDYFESMIVRRLLLLTARRLVTCVLYNSETTRCITGRPGPVFPSPLPAAFTSEPVRAPPPSDEFLSIVSIGRIDDFKGQDLVVQAIARMRARDHVSYTIVGTPDFGHESSLARLRALIDEHGLSRQVHLVGYVEDVLSIIDQSHVVVHFSKAPEALGQAIMQGLARGRPVVASEGGGASEMIQHGVTGFLVPAKDVNGLAQALDLLDLDPTLRQRMGSNAATVVSKYRLDRIQPEFVNYLIRAATSS